MLRMTQITAAPRTSESVTGAAAVTCGITFSFGGLKITTDGEVEDTTGRVIPGLFAGGELVGGIFYQNYLGGAGLMSGSVFGRIAGRSAGKYGAR